MKNTLYQNLTNTQSQGLSLTLQLRQAIHLLQLSNLELQDYFTQQIEENPLLGWEETYLVNDISDTDSYSLQQNQDNTLMNSLKNEDYDNVWESEPSSNDYSYNYLPSNSAQTSSDEEEDLMEKVISESRSIFQHIEEQIYNTFFMDEERQIALALMADLDEKGYFIGDCKGIANAFNTPFEKVQEILSILKTFEPAGIFAQDLFECYEMQLSEMDLDDFKMLNLLDYLRKSQTLSYDDMMKHCNLTSSELKDYLKKISILNKSVMNSFEERESTHILPDLYLKINENGQFSLELNQKTLPKVHVQHQEYHYYLKNITSGSQKTYLQKQYYDASHLLKALQQRNESLIKVAKAIIEKQKEFFINNSKRLIPLTLKDISLLVDLHESSVSRITQNKYIETPLGTFELKHFFSTGFAKIGQSQEIMASKSVQNLIKDIVKKENPRKPHSDESIVKELKKQGILIARRTITKYRDILKIPSAIERKKFAQLDLL